MSKKNIPTTITIDGKALQVKDVPELLALIEAVRAEEKDKLYGDIAKLEASVKTLEDKGKLSEEEATELKNLRKDVARKEVALEQKELELAEAKKAQKDTKKVSDKVGQEGSEDTDKIMAGLKDFLADQLAGVNKQLTDLKGDVEKRIGEVSGGLKTKTVADYRKGQLDKYAGVLVADLVPENLDSEAEVNKAIEKALERSQDLIYKEVDGKRLSLREIADTEKAKKDEAKKGGSTYTPPGQPPAPPGKDGDGDVTGKMLLKDVKKMTPDEYAKHRQSLLAEAKQVVYTGEAEEA